MSLGSGRHRAQVGRAWLLAALLVTAACKEERPPPAPAVLLPDAAPPATVAPPPLAPVTGASANDGAAVFARACASCHGADGRGAPDAGATDLTREAFLCRSTVGPRPMAADSDLDATLDHGSHRALPALAPAERRGVVLYVKTLSPGYARPPLPLLAVLPETADTPADRERGRILYFAVGCWRCHGLGGAGDGDFVRELAWNRRPLGRLRPLAEAGHLCGGSPERLYRTIALGLGTAPAIMPRHLEMLQYLSRPRDGDPETWTRALAGRIPEADLAKVRELVSSLPPRPAVLALPTEKSQARSAAYLWSLVHHVRAQREPGR